MNFSSLLMMAFAGQALGDKARALPQLAAVADAVAPAVSDAPVFRGRGANEKEAAAVASAVDLVSDEVRAAGSKVGLRGAVAEEETVTVCDTSGKVYLPQDMAGQTRTVASPEGCQQRCKNTSGCRYFNNWSNGGCHITTGADGVESGSTVVSGTSTCTFSRVVEEETGLTDWVYETITPDASVTRSEQGTLSAGSKSSHSFEEESVLQSRTTRKKLFRETQKKTRLKTNSVQASMTVGASMPVGVGSVSTEASSGFQSTMAVGIENSKTTSDEYQKETVSTFRTKTKQTFTPNPVGGDDKVVYREVWKLGTTVIKEVWKDCAVAEMKREGWALEEKKISLTVAVDHQWYRIKLGTYYLTAGVGGSLFTQTYDHYAYDQQWAIDQGHLINKNDGAVFCRDSRRYNCRVGPIGNLAHEPGAVVMRGTELKNGRYCMTLKNGSFMGVYIGTEECTGRSTQRWTAIKV